MKHDDKMIVLNTVAAAWIYFNTKLEVRLSINGQNKIRILFSN